MSNNIIDIDIIRNVNIRSDIKVDAIKVELMFDFDVISDMPDWVHMPKLRILNS